MQRKSGGSTEPGEVHEAMDPSPKCFRFVADAITPDAEVAFLAALDDDGGAGGGRSTLCKHSKWTQLKRRRLILAGALLGGPASSVAHSEIAGVTGDDDTKRNRVPGWMLSDGLINRINELLPPNVAPFTGEACGCNRLASETQDAIRRGDDDDDATRLNILINEYERPNGIMLHTDGPAYQPAVAIISMASAVPLVFCPVMRGGGPAASTARAAANESSIYDDDEDDGDVLRDSQQQQPEWMRRAALAAAFFGTPDLPFADGRANAHHHVPSLQDPRLGHPQSFCVLLPARSLVVFWGELYTDFMHGILDTCVDVIPTSRIANFAELQPSLSPLPAIDLSAAHASGSSSATTADNAVAERQLSSSSSWTQHESLLAAVANLRKVPRSDTSGVAAADAIIRQRGAPLFVVTQRGEAGADGTSSAAGGSRSAPSSVLVNVRGATRVSLTYRRVVA